VGLEKAGVGGEFKDIVGVNDDDFTVEKAAGTLKGAGNTRRLFLDGKVNPRAGSTGTDALDGIDIPGVSHDNKLGEPGACCQLKLVLEEGLSEEVQEELVLADGKHPPAVTTAEKDCFHSVSFLRTSLTARAPFSRRASV